MKKVFEPKAISLGDKKAIEGGRPEIELMMEAAKACFSSISWSEKVLIATGKGNNGGDGFAIALLLKQEGKDVHLLLGEMPVTDAAKYYFEECKKNSIPYSLYNNEESFDYPDIVDCLFGIGFRGKAKEPYSSIIKAINNSRSRVISVDANSGLDLSNGLAEDAVRSDITLSISALKPGYFLSKGKDYVGEIVELPLLSPVGEPYYLLEENDVKSLFLPRKNFSNKGNYGYVGILGGSSLYPGAVKLAFMGQEALYAGCGVSKVLVPSSIKDKLYPYVLETTIVPLKDEDGFMVFDEESLKKEIASLKSLSVGMGWGQGKDNEKILSYLITHYEGRLLIDADGLNTLAKLDQNILLDRKGSVILTPHIKEFSRLSGYSVDEIFASPIALAKEYAKKYKVTLLLKGPTTIITDGDVVYLTSTGSPGMATAGSGDVLSGLSAGLLGYSKEDDAFTMAVASYINGLGGEMAEDEFTSVSMTSSDTARNIKKVISSLLK